jgi:hypothetical protein
MSMKQLPFAGTYVLFAFDIGGRGLLTEVGG